MELTRIIDGIPAQSYNQEWIYDNQEVFINGAFVKDWILAPKYNGNYFFPKWNNENYYEGATLEEVAEIENIKKLDAKNYVQDLYVGLLKSALERATGKKGNLDYLKEQRAEYEKKYSVANQILNNEVVSFPFLVDTLNDEKEYEDYAGTNLNDALASFGLTSLSDRLKDYCQLIKFQFEYSNPYFLELESMIIYFRTRMVTDIDFGLWEKYEERLQLVFQITNEMDLVGIRNLYTQSKAL